MIKTISALILSILLLTACSETTKVSDDLPQSKTNTANPTGREARTEASPGERPVRIGEGGPRFDACQAVGRIQGLREASLDVHIAPFDSAKAKDTITSGQLVYICARSIDQQWFGIVYKKGNSSSDNEENADVVSNQDCGVSSPVRSKRNYDGPCASGWVESNFVKLVAG